jgi:hypothetical protein
MVLTLSVATGAFAQTPPPGVGTSAPSAKTAEEADPRESMCLLIEAAAHENDLPPDFFARVIWQESRFQTDVVSGQNAQGIAQFMPETAAQLRLLDPFDPIQALPKSAEFLRDLRTQFGNLGLAAAAYNGGPQRVRNWLEHSGSLSSETRSYVLAVTGRPVEDWANGEPAESVGLDCHDLIASSDPNRFLRDLETQVKLIAASPWGVQLSAGFSRARALTSYSRLAKQYAAILAGHDPSLLSTRLRSRGTRIFYQVRVGAQTRDGADSLCANIQRAGGACMVLRNQTFRRG